MQRYRVGEPLGRCLAEGGKIWKPFFKLLCNLSCYAIFQYKIYCNVLGKAPYCDVLERLYQKAVPEKFWIVRCLHFIKDTVIEISMENVLKLILEENATSPLRHIICPGIGKERLPCFFARTALYLLIYQIYSTCLETKDIILN